MIFFRECSGKPLSCQFRKIPRKTFKQFELPNLSPYLENWRHRKCLLWTFRQFLKLLRKCMWYNQFLFLINRRSFYILKLCRKFSHIHWYVPKSNSSRNSEKYTACKITKSELLTKSKVSWKFRNIFWRGLQWNCFLVNYRPTSYTLQSCVFLKSLKNSEITSATLLQ